MKEVQTLFVVVLVVWRLGGKKEEVFFCFLWRKRSQKSKKKIKNLSPFLGFTFSSRGWQHEKKKKKAISSLPNYFSSGPSVVEEDLEDLEDLHHHMVMFKKETTIS